MDRSARGCEPMLRLGHRLQASPRRFGKPTFTYGFSIGGNTRPYSEVLPRISK
jgi:hypothetical protein